jgi:dTDP-4-dehydrorhamnose 3,5-epimerase-like enzyme
MIEISPKYIDFNSIGDPSLGFITVAEQNKNVPFEIKRVYWTYHTPNNVIRGGHAHKELHQLIFAVSGKITFKTEDKNGKKNEFVLDDPKKGLYIPPYVWRDIQFSHNAVLLCLASLEYSELDYIRYYEEFKEITWL